MSEEIRVGQLAYIVTYAMSSGVMQKEVTKVSDCGKYISFGALFVSRKKVAVSREELREKVAAMAVKKIASLEKQLAKARRILKQHN